MRKLISDKKAALEYITMGIVILILAALAIPILGAVYSSINPSQLDKGVNTMLGTAATQRNITPAQNITATVMKTTGTVLGLNPLAALIAVAAGMIGLLMGAIYISPRGGV